MNRLLSLSGNDLIWSGQPGSPKYEGWNPTEWVEIKSYYINTRETLAHKSIYDHLTRMATVDEIINVNKRPKINANACHYCNANAMQMHKRSPSFRPNTE